MRLCSIAACESVHYGRGLCRKHWMRQRRTGTTDDSGYEPGQSPEFLDAIRPIRQVRVNECGHPERPHSGRGKCKSCYAIDWQKRNPEKSGNAWLARNPERSRELRRRAVLKRHGLTPEQYAEMWHLQGGRCANPGCGKSAPLIMRSYRDGLQVDHDHKTGVVRGLLCGPCNVTLGHVYDEPQRLLGLVEYLKQAN